MLLIQLLVHCALAFTFTTFSHNNQHQSSLAFDDSKLSKNPLFSLHKDLVDIESISGNEQAVAEFLEVHLESHNYTVERQYLEPLPTKLQASQRFNLLAYPGNRQTPVLLTSVSTRTKRSSPFLYRLLKISIFCGSKNSTI